MTNYRLRTIAVIYIAISAFCTNASATINSDLFAQGTKHFNKQEYQSAAKSFQNLIDSGDRRAIVYYNLGVSEYKLEKLDLAEEHFKKISSKSEFSDPAVYNIGLIYTKRDKFKEARKWFKKVNKTNKELYKHAKGMIKKIDNADNNTSVFNKARGLLSLTLGRDDNVNRVADNSPTNVNDNFYITYAAVSIPTSKKTNSLFFGASYYAINYSNLGTNDFSILRANIGYKKRLNKWKTKSSFSYATSNLGGSSYQNSIRLSFNARLRLSEKSYFKATYKFDNINSSDVTNAYLDGWKQQVRLSYKVRIDDMKMEARYKLTLNNRSDTPTESFSPTRHSIRGILSKPISELWTVGTDIAYRASDYPVIGVTGRTENRLLTALFANYKLANNWTIETKFKHTSNDSDDLTFKYNRNEFLINTAYTF